jgi:hypothetical protein
MNTLNVCSCRRTGATGFVAPRAERRSCDARHPWRAFLRGALTRVQFRSRRTGAAGFAEVHRVTRRVIAERLPVDLQ